MSNNNDTNGERERIANDALFGLWQPIETAPKIGQFLVLLETEMVGCRIHPMTRHKNLASIGCYFDFDAGTPTHWMPLPSLPNVEDRRK